MNPSSGLLSSFTSLPKMHLDATGAAPQTVNSLKAPGYETFIELKLI